MHQAKQLEEYLESRIKGNFLIVPYKSRRLNQGGKVSIKKKELLVIVYYLFKVEVLPQSPGEFNVLTDH